MNCPRDMNKQSASSLHFQRKIFDFYQARIFPIASRQEFENIRSYLINLILYRKKPPMRSNGIDWRAVAEVCGIENKLRPGVAAGSASGI